MKKLQPIMNREQAHAKLNAQIEKALHEIATVESTVGDVSEPEDSEIERHTTVEELMARTPRQWSISQLRFNRELVTRLQETKEEELIFPHGKYVMLPKGAELLSPSGFHCDEQVFKKPERGCTVDKLPRSSDMLYYDFT